MQRSIALTGLFLLVVFSLQACAKPRNVRVEQRESFAEASPQTKNYIKRVAIAPRAVTPGTFLHQADDQFTEVLTTAMQSKAKRLEVAPFSQTDPNPRDLFAFVENARLSGYHHLLDASILNVRASERKTGIWWLRKTRYFLTVVVHLDVYDTFTAAKVTSRVREKEVKVDAGAYETFLSGSLDNIAVLDKAIAGMARQLGRHAADVIVSAPWKTAVSAVHEDRVELTAGQVDGLQVGDRWALYEGRRTVEGYGGERFIAPGYMLGTMHIIAISASGAIGQVHSPADVRVGDIAVPVK